MHWASRANRIHWGTVLLVLCFSLPVFSQVDRDFWFAVPYLSNDHDNSLSDGQGQLCITSFERATTVRISQPAVTNAADRYWFAPIVLTLPPYSSVDVPVQQGGLYRASQGAVSSCGLHIESDQDITVYYAQINQNSEIYTLKGRNALGTDFLVPMQRTRANSFTGYSTIEIVATLPNTTVTVTTPVPTMQNPNGTSFVRVLQKGEILTVRSVGQAAANHLGGTVIHADQPVAVNSTDDSVADWGQDLIGEQIVPTGLAGNEYIAVKHDGNAEDIVLYALPGQPLRYTVNGGASQTLAAGGSTTIPLSSRTTYIQGDTEFVAFQITSDGAELGGTVLPRLDCTGSHEVAITRRFGSQTVNLLVKTPYVSSFTVNGQSHTFAFQPVPNAPDWSWCQVSASSLFDTKGVMRIRNTQAVFHASILDYGNGTCTYGYFSGYNRVDMVPTVSKSVYLVGEQIELGVEQASLFTSVVWTSPDGTQYSGAEWQHKALSLQDAGWYTVTAESVDGCPLAQDEYAKLVQVIQPIRRDSDVCRSETVTADTWSLYDTVHAGVSVLRAEPRMEAVCTSAIAYTPVWQTRAEVEQGVTYRLLMDYSSPSNTHPSIRITWSDTVITIPSTFVRSTPRTLSVDRVAESTNTIDLVIETGMASNSPKIVLDNIALVPLLPVQDTLYMHVKNCDTPNPPVDPEDPPVDPPVDPEDPPVEPEDPPVDPEDPPVDPPMPVATLQVRVVVPEVTVCDGDRSFDLPYEIQTGTPHLARVSYAGQVYPLALTDAGIVEVPLDSLMPGPYSLEALFVDTLNRIECACTVSLQLLYEPQKIFAQKWDNVLAIFQPDYCGYHLAFTSYQWYRNGEPVAGETFSYYHLDNASFSPQDYYQVLLVRQTDGLKWMTCPYHPYVPHYNQSPAVQCYTPMGQPVPDTQRAGIYIILQGEERRKIIKTHE